MPDCGPHGAVGSREAEPSGVPRPGWQVVSPSWPPTAPSSPPQQDTATDKQGLALCCLKARPRGNPLSVRKAGPVSTESGFGGRRPRPLASCLRPTPAWCPSSSGAAHDCHVPSLNSSAGHRCPFRPVPSPQDKAAAKGGASISSHPNGAGPIRRGSLRLSACPWPRPCPLPDEQLSSAAPDPAWSRLLCPLGPCSGLRTSRGRTWDLTPPAAEATHPLRSQKPQGTAHQM